MKFFVTISLIFCSSYLYSQQYTPLGDGLHGNSSNQLGITSMCEFNGKLVASGYFTKSDNLTLQNIAVWDGVNWTDVGCPSGIVSPAEAMCVYNGELYIGGILDVCEIDTNIGATKTYIAKWDGMSWSQVGLKAGDDCKLINCMIVYKNELYIGGSFTKIGGVSAKNIAKWNGQSWSNLGSGVYGGLFGVLTMDIFNGELYVGGDFKYANGIATGYIAKWNGSNWDSLITSPNSIVKSLKVDSANNKIYVSGNFTKTGGLTSYGVASWDGNLWESLAPIDTMNYVMDLEIYNNMLYAISYDKTITNTGDTLIFFYRYNIRNSKWEKIINDFDNTPSVLLKHEDKLIIGGYYSLPYKSILCYKDLKSGIFIDSFSDEIIFFPNPTSKKLNIRAKQVVTNIKLFDEGGRQLFSKDLNSKVNSISMMEYPIGIYFIEITLKNQKKIVSKIVKRDEM